MNISHMMAQPTGFDFNPGPHLVSSTGNVTVHIVRIVEDQPTEIGDVPVTGHSTLKELRAALAQGGAMGEGSQFGGSPGQPPVSIAKEGTVKVLDCITEVGSVKTIIILDSAPPKEEVRVVFISWSCP